MTVGSGAPYYGIYFYTTIGTRGTRLRAAGWGVPSGASSHPAGSYELPLTAHNHGCPRRSRGLAHREGRKPVREGKSLGRFSTITCRTGDGLVPAGMIRGVLGLGGVGNEQSSKQTIFVGLRAYGAALRDDCCQSARRAQRYFCYALLEAFKTNHFQGEAACSELYAHASDCRGATAGRARP
eukprot:6196516-Pleurochrysis_carterae.AAC.4